MTILTHSASSTHQRPHRLALCTKYRGRWSIVAVTLTLLGSLLFGGSVTDAAPDRAPQSDPRDLKVQATMSEVVRILEEISRDPTYGEPLREILCLMCLLANPDEPELCDKWCSRLVMEGREAAGP